MSGRGPLRIAALVLLGAAFLELPAPAERGRGRLVLSRVTVVNPGEARTGDADVHVASGRIERITASPRRGRREPRFVLPGLVDLHVHVWSERADLTGLLFLLHGVTTVRDAGDSEGLVFATRDAWAEGPLLGPRIFACGPFVDGEAATWPGSRIVRSAEDALPIVDDLARLGASCVKLYRHLRPEAIAALGEAARRRGLAVIGHVPEGVTLAEAGLDDVQHLTGIPALTTAPDAPLERRIEEWVAAWRDLPEERLDEAARVSLERGIAHTPTLVFWQRFFRLLDPEDPPEALRRAIPRAHRDAFWQRTKPWSETRADRRDARAALRRMQDAVARFHAEGVRVLLGTDTLNPYNVPGESLHEEIRLFVEAGIPLEEVWRIATRSAAEALGRRDLGVVAEGAAADLLVFREDPTRDLDALATLEGVVVRGRWHSRRSLTRRLAAIRREDAPLEMIGALWTRVLDGLGFLERKL